MSYVSHDKIGWREVHSNVSGKYILPDKDIDKVYISLNDYITQVETISEQLKEANWKKNSENFFNENKTEINLKETESSRKEVKATLKALDMSLKNLQAGF